MILQVYGSSFATLRSFDVPQIGGLKMMAGYEGLIPGKPMVNKSLTKVYFWGGTLGVVWLTGH